MTPRPTHGWCDACARSPRSTLSATACGAADQLARSVAAGPVRIFAVLASEEQLRALHLLHLRHGRSVPSMATSGWATSPTTPQRPGPHHPCYKPNHVEIWNEPNIEEFGDVPPERMADIFMKAKRTIAVASLPPQGQGALSRLGPKGADYFEAFALGRGRCTASIHLYEHNPAREFNGSLWRRFRAFQDVAGGRPFG